MENVMQGNHLRGARILVKPAPQKAKTKGGIFIPDTAEVLHMKGEVALIGDTVRKYEEGNGIKTPLEVKDLVIFNANSGAEIEIDEEKYLLLMYHEVWFSSKP